eukprot:1158853-Rhodomonas_salina.1
MSCLSYRATALRYKVRLYWGQGHEEGGVCCVRRASASVRRAPGARSNAIKHTRPTNCTAAAPFCL